MPQTPPSPAWKQMAPIALVVLTVGFYGQYTRASGVFAADGLVDQAEQFVQRLLEPALDVPPDALPADLATESGEIASPIAEPFASDFRPGPGIPPRGGGAPFAGQFGACSSRHCR